MRCTRSIPKNVTLPTVTKHSTISPLPFSSRPFPVFFLQRFDVSRMWSGKTRDSCPGEEMMASRRVQWPGLPASAQHVRPRTRSSFRPATSSLQPPLTNALQQIRRLSPGGGALDTSASHRSRLLSRWRHCQRLAFIVVSPPFTIMRYTSWTLNITSLVC